eukprot:TRINITY_DN3204_c0_g1_i3.p1 TRINITY_DN3204_c0_g1~~TRINITY_DN3204_c0_g1_i3.p1  ORF type:complete len:252 (+),score=31.10 TRINITY_DN3204_c0_g1_i3:1222-1977(+)
MAVSHLVSCLPESEAKKYLQPTGLYAKPAAWDDAAVRALILQRKLSPRYPGHPDQNPEETLEECSICCLFYPMLNRLSCCPQSLCTECYLQSRPQTDTRSPCPFCKNVGWEVQFTGPLDAVTRSRLKEEEQRVMLAQIRAQQQELEDQMKREQDLKLQKAAQLSQKSTESATPSLGDLIPRPHVSHVSAKPESTTVMPAVKRDPEEEEEEEEEDAKLQYALRLSLQQAQSGAHFFPSSGLGFLGRAFSHSL